MKLFIMEHSLASKSDNTPRLRIGDYWLIILNTYIFQQNMGDNELVISLFLQKTTVTCTLGGKRRNMSDSNYMPKNEESDIG